MDSSELFGPTVGAYVSYCIGFCIRYFAVAGGIYWFLHVGFKRKWLAYRIQQTFPSRHEVVHEIRWSMVNMACTGLSTILLYRLIRAGQTRMYFDVADHAWLYLGVSSLLCVVGYDAWFYWQHRLLHTSWLFRRVHAIHHHVANPTPFAAFAHHPIETFMANLYFILFVMCVPVHPMALGAVAAGLFTLNLIVHMGYEFYPQGFTRHRLFRWCGTSTHHNMHHRHVGYNYGILFNYWDRLMGTNHPAYHDTFEAIKARLEVAPGVPPPAASPGVRRPAATNAFAPEAADSAGSMLAAH